MMNFGEGWMGGWMWAWWAMGLLVVALLVVLISRSSRK